MFKRTLLLAVVLAFCVCATSSFAVDMNPGNWEHTVVMKMAGLPFAPPPTVSTGCLTKEDMVPKAVSDEGMKCTMLDSKVSGNEVTWSMKCTGESGVSSSKGAITYHGDTYKGKVDIVTSGMTVHSDLSGKRLGACN